MTTRESQIKEGVAYVNSELRGVVKKYGLYKCMSRDDIEDMRSEGFVKLIELVDKYDPRKRTKLRTYLTPRLKWFFIDYLRKVSRLRNVENNYAIEAVSEKITNVFHLPRQVAELELKELSSDEIKNLYLELYDIGVLPNQVVLEEVMRMSDKRVYVLLSVYVLNKSIREISDSLGLSTTSGWVYKMHRQCIHQLRDKLSDYLQGGLK